MIMESRKSEKKTQDSEVQVDFFTQVLSLVLGALEEGQLISYHQRKLSTISKMSRFSSLRSSLAKHTGNKVHSPNKGMAMKAWVLSLFLFLIFC